MKRLTSLIFALALVGCQTTMDPNYALQLESYRLTISSQQNVELARARAEEARYAAIAAVAERADPASKNLAILALALSRSGEAAARPVEVALPRIPESQDERAWKWASLIVPSVTNVALAGFSYSLGRVQSNNQASTTNASYQALASFKPQPVDFSTIRPNVTTITTNTNEISNRGNGAASIGGDASVDNSLRPPVFNTPVVVVPPVVPIVPVVTGP